jgi:hypothetical protein
MAAANAVNILEQCSDNQRDGLVRYVHEATLFEMQRRRGDVVGEPPRPPSDLGTHI